MPGPGGDPIRNPDVLPTGKNMHALDPQSIPTRLPSSLRQGVVDRFSRSSSARTMAPTPSHRLYPLGYRQHQDLRRVPRAGAAYGRCPPVPDPLAASTRSSSSPRGARPPPYRRRRQLLGRLPRSLRQPDEPAGPRRQARRRADEPPEMNFRPQARLGASRGARLSVREAATASSPTRWILLVPTSASPSRTAAGRTRLSCRTSSLTARASPSTLTSPGSAWTQQAIFKSVPQDGGRHLPEP